MTAARPIPFSDAQLGMGLTQLGRRWGARPADVPTEAHALLLLSRAVELGIRVFDTAPSYGSSETRLGRFLESLAPGQRSTLCIMTKCGEEWDDTTGVAHTDHRYESLVASIDCSLERLGAIEVLQLHRAKAETLRSAGVQRAIDHARAAGVPVIGASVSDLTSARVAVEELGLRLLQFPFSADNTYMEEAFAMARDVACTVVVNRPLGMGRLAYREASNPSADPACITEAFRFVLARQFDGVVLSGTASLEHLAMNVGCFRSALASTRTSRPGVARG